MTHTPFIGVSLKAYFGRQETFGWCRRISDVIDAHSPAVSGAVDIAVFPSHPFILGVTEIFDGQNVIIGAQDVSAHSQGPFTGEVTANQLADLGVGFVEVGHAERREHFGEDDQLVAAKISAGLSVGIPPMLCVGESEARGPDYAAEVCIEQIESALGAVATDHSLSGAVIAYEPVWAIGEINSASPEHILGVHEIVRHHLDTSLTVPDMRIIYGGSAGPGLFGQISNGPSGLFLGRFAHDIDNFQKILQEVLESPAGTPADTVAH